MLEILLIHTKPALVLYGFQII